MVLKYAFICMALVLCLSQCTSLDKPMQSPDGYNLNQPERMSVPERLVEISGITFKNENTDTLLAIQDEEGRIFKLAWKNKNVIHERFASNGDFEDIAVMGNTIFILRSDGTLYSMPADSFNKKEKKNATEWKKIIPKEEYESLYADQENKQLYILCKTCSIDKDEHAVTGYIIDVLPGDSLQLNSTFKIPTTEINTQKGKHQPLQPSALAKHPLTGQWFILSSIHKRLVVADSHWNVTASYQLRGKEFNQPEGMAFDRNNNLYISNEGDEITNGNILKFSFKAAK